MTQPEHLGAHAFMASGVFGPGSVLDGKYRIEGAVARGGMSVIVRATHMALDRPVAIKFLRTDATREVSAAALAQFEREGRLVAKMKSEHVVRVHDVGAHQQLGPFLVMEYLEGIDLGQLLLTSPPDPTEAVGYVLEACGALSEAHALGIVHRDLKPANLFLAARTPHAPILKVIDFGIAGTVPQWGDPNAPTDEPLVGTPAYMSPEQIRGEPLDARADVWSLGVLLYELLTGEMPFPESNADALLKRILEGKPVPLRERRPELPEGLEAVITSCLQKNPVLRFANVARLATQLAPFGPADASSAVMRIATTVGDPAANGLIDSSPSGRFLALSEQQMRQTDPRRQALTVVVSERPRRLLPFFLGAMALALAGLGLMAVARSRASTRAAAAADGNAAVITSAVSASPSASVAAASASRPVASASASVSASSSAHAPEERAAALAASAAAHQPSGARLASPAPARPPSRPPQKPTTASSGATPSNDRSMFGERR